MAKKMFVGGLVSAGLGIATTLIGNAKQKKAEEKLKKQQFQSALDQRTETDEAILDNYPTDGYATDELYAKGGKLGTNKIPDSNSQELANGVEKVVNAGTHESGNDVDVSDGAGDVKAKVEDQEVILDGDKVLSERLGYADVAEGISSAKGDIEKVLQGDNLKRLHNRDKATFEHTMSPLKRTLAKLDEANEANFKAQEENKATSPQVVNTPTPQNATIPNEAVPKALFGLSMIHPEEGEELTEEDKIANLKTKENRRDVGNIATAVADNAVGLLQRTPNVPKPISQTAAKLNTDVDISGDLQDIKDQSREGTVAIDQNTNNSNVALARKASLRNNARRAKSTLRSGARKEETQLENVDSLNRQRVSNANTSAQNEYASNVMTRDVFKNEKLLNNISNVGQDVRQFNVDKASAARDERAILASMSQNASTGSNYNEAMNGSLDGLSVEGKLKVIAQLKAAGRDVEPIKKLYNL